MYSWSSRFFSPSGRLWARLTPSAEAHAGVQDRQRPYRFTVTYAAVSDGRKTPAPSKHTNNVEIGACRLLTEVVS